MIPAVYEVDSKRITIQDVVTSTDVAALDILATRASVDGAALEALSYLAAYRIYEIYGKVDETDGEVLRRHLRALGHAVPKTGATGLRRHYCGTLYGWETFNAWLNDWASSVPVSRSSGWHKMWDILGWRNMGVGWETILKLLTNTPMAGRDILDKPVKQEALPPGGMVQYAEELAELPPGQARKKVSEDAGEPQIWTADVQWHQGSLLLKVILETSEGNVSYDLLCHQVSSHESWMAVAFWLAQKLGIRMKIG